MNIIINIIYVVILFIDKFLKILNKNYFRYRIYQKIRDNFYKINYHGKTITFFTPSLSSRRRAESVHYHEPETIEWIKNFKKTKDSKEIVFWDVGACIGQFSMLAGLYHKNIKICSFEPSTKNLNLLSTNISINKLNNKIILCPFPLSDESFAINNMLEKINEEGKASNQFTMVDEINKKFKYSTIGFSSDFLIKNFILPPPNYLKIDTDGNEKNIIDGSIDLIRSNHLNEIQIELTENSSDADYCINLLLENNFKIIKKFREKKYENVKKHIKLFNFRLKKN